MSPMREASVTAGEMRGSVPRFRQKVFPVHDSRAGKGVNAGANFLKIVSGKTTGAPRAARGKPPEAVKAIWRATLLQNLQKHMRHGVGLRKHGRGALGQNLVADKERHFHGNIRV